MGRDLGLLEGTVLFGVRDFLSERRSWEMFVYNVMCDKILAPLTRTHGVKCLPMELSWQFFKDPAEGHCGTLTSHQKLILCDFTSDPLVIRPFLPEELFSLQGCSVEDLWPDQGRDVLDWLAGIFSYRQVVRRVSAAYRGPSVTAAVVAALLALPRLH